MNDTEFEKALKEATQVCIGDDNDLIRRGDALNAIREVRRIGCLPSSALTREEQRNVVLLDALQAVRTVKKATVPTIDPDSLRPMAKWEKSFYKSREDGKFIVCTRCRHAFSRKGLWCRKYCPECGARMVNYENITK